VSPSGELSTLHSFVERTPDPYCVVGRRSEGTTARDAGARRSLGRFFQSCAELEAASVGAFLSFARELAAHGAPAELSWRARQAALDEVRHARRVARLARRFGGRPRFAPATSAPPRSLEATLIDNAVEGCVRETYAALVARHQGLCAGNAHVRREYAQIARDEARHASLSWDAARWGESRLPAPARARIARARAQAASELIAQLRDASRTPIDRDAGLPTPARGARMAERLERHLWRR
jgi:hypothetical protein